MPKLFYPRSLRARCPFCGAEIPRPEAVAGGQWFDFNGGFCPCGAAFAHDPTARNGGAVLLQAMLMACGGDMDRVLELSEGVNYDEGHVNHYDEASHQVDQGAFGTLYFVRCRREGE